MRKKTFLTPLALLACAMPIAAQDYPVKSVRILVGFAPGGGIDISARLLAPGLGTALGQQVIVDNRPGAGSNIAAELAAKAPPDGYTLLLASIALAINPSLYGKLPFDPARDFTPIGQTGTMSNILVVHPVLPVGNVREFVALAKRQPGKLSYATPGAGSSAHLAGELFRKAAGIDMVIIPYKGGGQAVIDVIAGHVPVFFASVPVVMSHVKDGRFKALAVTTARRAAAMPDTPTIAESGYPGYEVNNWYGLVAPAGTPRAVVERLAREAATIVTSRDTSKRLADVGHEGVTSTSEQFGAYIKSELARWGRIVKETGVKVQ
jgi:tripartite-type tricarboxylate transporter receptor subunit TctC